MGKEKTVIFQATGIDNSVCMTAQSQHLRLGGCFVSIVFFDFFIVLFQSFQKIFNILSFGVLVGRAGVVNDGFILCERRDFFFADVNHRADDRKPLSVEFRHGGEGGKPAFVKQR